MIQSPYEEPGYVSWQDRLAALSSSDVTIRMATPTAEDGKWMRWMQADSESAYIHGVEDNVTQIGKQLVFFAEISNQPVGFCRAVAGRTDSDPIFIQLVAVVPLARRRGVGRALLFAAAEREPRRDIAMATLDTNDAARRLNETFAVLIGATIRRVPKRQYRRTDLGFAEGELHRTWIIERPEAAL